MYMCILISNKYNGVASIKIITSQYAWRVCLCHADKL